MREPNSAVPEPGVEPHLDLLGLRLPLRASVVVLVATFALLLDYYHNFAIPSDPLLSQGIDRPVLYLVVPVLVLLAMGERPRDHGLRIGEWRIGLPVMIVAGALITPVVVWLGGQPDFIGYYNRPGYDLGVLLATFAADVLSAEFLFRGFLLFTLVRAAGPVGVLLATFPFVFMHIGKPELETFSTLFGGLFLGWLAWRTRSVLYGGLLHAYFLDLLLIVTAAR